MMMDALPVNYYHTSGQSAFFMVRRRISISGILRRGGAGYQEERKILAVTGLQLQLSADTPMQREIYTPNHVR